MRIKRYFPEVERRPRRQLTAYLRLVPRLKEKETMPPFFLSHGFLLRTVATYSSSTKNNKQMRRGLPLAAKWIPPAPYRHSFRSKSRECRTPNNRWGQHYGPPEICMNNFGRNLYSIFFYILSIAILQK